MIAALCLYLFLIPCGILVRDLLDPHLRDGGMPAAAVRLHDTLSPRYERWARQRLSEGRAEQLNLEDISGTEWPLFGSAFYLWATESLQLAWDKDHMISPQPPRDYARGAIEAAAALLADPGQAAWVQKHWGNEYRSRENVFYRMLLISGLTSHQKLLGTGQYLPLIREQVDGLAGELDASPHGLLNDYPGECYPTDVHSAIAAIRRADAVLGTDHSAFVARALRAFQGPLLDPVGLPPYAADPTSGSIHGRSRGCGDSFVLVFTPELWPDVAKQWYAAYERNFWQHRWTADGFREFPKDEPGYDWYMDVDSGPVIAGHGIAACAFGLAAARANGRFDHAWPLASETLVTSWPLPDGTLACPRILSNAIDAPYLGEAGVLFCLTRQPVPGVSAVAAGGLPAFVYLVLAAYFVAGALPLWLALRGLRRSRKRDQSTRAPIPRLQLVLWAALLLSGAFFLVFRSVIYGLILVLAAQLLPRLRKSRQAAASPANVP